MLGNKDKNGDGDIRKGFPGGWKNDANNAFTNSGRTKRQQDYFNFTQKIFNWRKGKSVIHTGKTMQFIPQNNVYVFFRYNDNERVMVVINNNPETQEFDLNRFEEMIKDSKIGNDIISGKTISLENKLKIEGKTSMVIELN
jgi:glycosidase